LTIQRLLNISKQPGEPERLFDDRKIAAQTQALRDLLWKDDIFGT
jgi:hypothetical protein